MSCANILCSLFILSNFAIFKSLLKNWKSMSSPSISNPSFCQHFECQFKKERIALLEEIRAADIAFSNSFTGKSITKIQHSHYTKARKPFFKAIEKLQFLAKFFFKLFLPEIRLTGLTKSFNQCTDVTLSYLNTTFGIFDKSLNFWNVLDEFGFIPTIESIIMPENRRKKSCSFLIKYNKIKADLNSSNQYKKKLARLKAIKLTEWVLDIPEVTYKFCSLFVKSIPSTVKQIITPVNIISLGLSIAGPFITHLECKSTAQLRNDIRAKRIRTFILGVETSESKSELKKLSIAELLKRSNAIKKNLSAAADVDLLDRVNYESDLAFIKRVEKELKNPKLDIIKKHFDVKKIKKNGKNKLNHKTCKTFFEKLSYPRIQGDRDKVAVIAKNLDQRLTEKVAFDRAAIAHKIVSLFSSIITTIVTTAALYAPHIILSVTVIPFVSGVGGTLAIVSIVELFYRHYREKDFIKNMENLTSKTPIIAPRV